MSSINEWILRPETLASLKSFTGSALVFAIMVVIELSFNKGHCWGKVHRDMVLYISQ